MKIWTNENYPLNYTCHQTVKIYRPTTTYNFFSPSHTRTHRSWLTTWIRQAIAGYVFTYPAVRVNRTPTSFCPDALILKPIFVIVHKRVGVFCVLTLTARKVIITCCHVPPSGPLYTVLVEPGWSESSTSSGQETVLLGPETTWLWGGEERGWRGVWNHPSAQTCVQDE